MSYMNVKEVVYSFTWPRTCSYQKLGLQSITWPSQRITWDITVINAL
jgi:hypothetical protein